VVISISGLGSEEIQRELQSLGVVAESQTVLAPVSQQFEIPVPQLRDAFEASIIGDSTVLRFTANADDPETALAINEAIVTSYLDVANRPVDQDELQFLETQIAAIEDQIATIDSQLSSLETTLASNTSMRLQIETDRDVTQAKLADLEGRLVDLRASGEAPSGSISFVEGQINETAARRPHHGVEAPARESDDAGTLSDVNRLQDERAVLRSEMTELESLRLGFELEQIGATRVAVLAPGHVVDDPVGLTPTRAVALGLLVGGALAFAWVVAATQLRRRR
jgi:uncharacterized protein YlxP (DUF503 family)